MEKLLRKLINNDIEIRVTPLTDLNQVCINFSKIINGQAFIQDYYLDITVMHDNDYYDQLLDFEIDTFLRYCKHMTMPLT